MTNEKLAKLIEKMKSMPIEAEPAVNCQEYSWAVPHYFKPEHEGSINEFVNFLAKNIADGFSLSCYDSFKSKCLSVSQHWGNCFISDVLTDNGQYYVEIVGGDNKVCGLLVIPRATATFWIASVLMDTKSKQVEKDKLSSIEESLLLDAGSSIVGSFSKSLVSRNGLAVKSSGKIINDRFALKIGNIQELIEIVFTIENQDNQTEASLVLFSQVLDNVAGISAKKKQSPSPEAVSAAIISKINKSSLHIRAELGSTNLKMSELLTVGRGDIIRMDKMIDEKVSVQVGGQTVAKGWPVQSKGKIAVQI